MNPSIRPALAAGFLLAAAGSLLAQPKRVYIGNDDHTDYVWNCSEATNRQAFLDMLDYYLDLKDATLANPVDWQSRFNCDSALMLRVYEEERTPAQFERLIRAIRSGHISAPMTTLVNTYGGTPVEGVLRGMYYAGQVERRHDLRFRLAMSMENQTMPWGLSSLWAGSGAKYSWRGVCGCVTRTPFAGRREHEVYWYTGPDGRRILLKWYSAANNNPDSSIGGYAEARFIQSAVDYVTVNAPFNGFLDRHPYDVIGVFGHGWDNNASITDEFVRLAPLLSDATRRVIVSNELDYFQDFEARYGDQIGAVDYSFGNEWELYQSSMAELTARVRRAVEKTRSAEAMASIVSLSDPSFMNGREADRLAFNLGLGMYWEHDWTGDGGFAGEKVALQRRLAGDIERYVNALHADSAAALGGLITPSAGTPGGTQFFVFNPLGFARSDAADLPWAAGGPVSVYDLSGGAPGVEVPAQVVTVDGERSLRVWVADVPSVGYRVLEARPVAGAVFTDAATVSAPVGGGGVATATYAIAADNRDAQSLRSGGPQDEVRVSGYNAGDRHTYWGTDSEQQTAGLEFAVALPPGTVVTEARLVLRASPGSIPSATGASRIRMYDIDDAQPFANGFLGDLVTHHPVAATQILWPAPGWPGGGVVVSPDLAALVQAFVNRPGYTPGKHLGLVIDEGGLPADRYYGFEDFSKPGGTPAQLVVSYQSGGGGGGGSPDRVIENGRYKIVVTPRGAIVSLVDKTRGDREFAGSVGGRAVNDLGGGQAADGGGVLTVENAGPVSVTLKAVAGAPLAHTTRVTLFRFGERLDLHNRITQNFDSIEDWSFAFNLASPLVRHEEVGAIMTARLRTAGGDYATQNARYDWLSLNHFADMSGDGGVGVTLSNIDTPFFRLGASSVRELETATAQISPVAGGRLDGPGLGLPEQGGDSQFTQRFALRTRSGADAPAAMRFALEHANPLVAGVITGARPTLPSGVHSFITVSNPDVVLWALKPAEDGPSAPGGPLTVRLWNVSDSGASATIQTAARPIRAGATATHLETLDPVDPALGPAPTVSGLGLTAAFARQQVRTFRLDIGCAADFNADGVVDPDDLSDYIACFFEAPACPRADVNADGFADPDDLSDYISGFFSGGC